MYTTHAPVITSEYLLHYIWRTKQFNRLNLKLTDGRKVEIIDFGKYNTNSGPDFLHGKVRVDDTLLIGHIEMHLSSSDWDLHRHQFDPAYNSVILHVVARHDKEVCNYNDHELITLELGELIHTDVAERYALLQNRVGFHALIWILQKFSQISGTYGRNDLILKGCNPKSHGFIIT